MAFLGPITEEAQNTGVCVGSLGLTLLTWEKSGVEGVLLALSVHDVLRVGRKTQGEK